MTISTNADVIARNDLTAQPEKILHTDDIAGTAKADPKEFIEPKHRDGDVAAKLEPLFAAEKRVA